MEPAKAIPKSIGARRKEDNRTASLSSVSRSMSNNEVPRRRAARRATLGGRSTVEMRPNHTAVLTRSSPTTVQTRSSPTTVQTGSSRTTVQTGSSRTTLKTGSSRTTVLTGSSRSESCLNVNATNYLNEDPPNSEQPLGCPSMPTLGFRSEGKVGKKVVKELEAHNKSLIEANMRLKGDILRMEQRMNRMEGHMSASAVNEKHKWGVAEKAQSKLLDRNKALDEENAKLKKTILDLTESKDGLLSHVRELEAYQKELLCMHEKEITKLRRDYEGSRAAVRELRRDLDKAKSQVINLQAELNECSLLREKERLEYSPAHGEKVEKLEGVMGMALQHIKMMKSELHAKKKSEEMCGNERDCENANGQTQGRDKKVAFQAKAKVMAPTA